MGSTDRTLEIAKAFGASIHHWDTAGKFDDNLNTRKNQKRVLAWAGRRLGDGIGRGRNYLFSASFSETLLSYDRQNLAVARPHGFEMLHDTWPNPAKQIYDEAKFGARLDDYSKPVLFAPKRIRDLRFSTGAHTLDEIRLRGNTLAVNLRSYSEPPCFLLHYHQIGPADKIAARYDETRPECPRRISGINGAVNGAGQPMSRKAEIY